jgi:hypothetical protein
VMGWGHLMHIWDVKSPGFVPTQDKSFHKSWRPSIVNERDWVLIHWLTSSCF